MEKQTAPDALDRALTDLCRTHLPEGYRAAWRAAVKREELKTLNKPARKTPVWRVALPVAAALVLVIGAISAGNLIPTVVTDTLYSMPATAYQSDMALKDGDAGRQPMQSPAPDAAQAYDANEWSSDSAAAPQAAVSRAASELGMIGGGTITATGTAASDANTAQNGVKIVRTADLTLATTAFDEDTAAVQTLTTQAGGYVASVNISGEASVWMDRVAYYSLRIPSDQLDAFLNGLKGIGRITSRYETASDQSTQYADTELRLTTQREKMNRLQALLKQAADVSDLLEIETEIADTQYTLDQLESALREIDRDVSNSAVTVTLVEQSAGDTAQAVELTLWQRIGGGFTASLKGLSSFGQNVLVFLAMLLPALVPLAALAALLWLLHRAWRKNHPKQAQSSQQEAEANAYATAYRRANTGETAAPDTADANAKADAINPDKPQA